MISPALEAMAAKDQLNNEEEKEILNLEKFLDDVVKGKSVPDEATDFIIDRVKKEYKLLKKYEKPVEEGLKANERKLFRYIAGYRDKYIHILSSPYPTNYPKFGVKDAAIIFDVCNIDKDEMEEDINQVTIPEGAAKKRFITAFPCLMLLILRYYLKTKQTDKFSACIYYLGYSFYWMAYTNSFTKFLPMERYVVYAINNLSNRYFLKVLGSVDLLIYYCTLKTIACYRERLLRASDYELFYITDGVRTRIGNVEKKIAERIYAAKEEQAVVLKGEDELGEGASRMTDSKSEVVEKYAQQYTDKFFGNPPRLDLIKKSATMNGVSWSELRTAVQMIIDSQDVSDVMTFYRACFFFYFGDARTNNRKYFDAKLFIILMDEIYKKGNSADPNIVQIKNLMNRWLDRGSATYRATSRLATQNNFRKAIYYYFVLNVAVSANRS